MSEERKRFEELAKKLVSVPKDEIDKEVKKDERKRKLRATRKVKQNLAGSDTTRRNPQVRLGESSTSLR
jgi:hypothetical protein